MKKVAALMLLCLIVAGGLSAEVITSPQNIPYNTYQMTGYIRYFYIDTNNARMFICLDFARGVECDVSTSVPTDIGVNTRKNGYLYFKTTDVNYKAVYSLLLLSQLEDRPIGYRVISDMVDGYNQVYYVLGPK